MSTHVPFIVRGVPRKPPSMHFPAGTTYAMAKEAFEAAHPDYEMGEAFEAVADASGPDETGALGYEEGEAGDFCDDCGRFLPYAEDKASAPLDALVFCLLCNAKDPKCFDRMLEEWHGGAGDYCKVWEYMGITRDEYAAIVEGREVRQP